MFSALFPYSNRLPWFDTLLSYNPAIHRTKQALFHCAVVPDITTNPLPPPHPELLKYFDPPKRVIKRSREAIDECKNVFKVKQGITACPPLGDLSFSILGHQFPRKSQ